MSLRSVLSICVLSLLLLARTHAQSQPSTFQAEVNLIVAPSSPTSGEIPSSACHRLAGKP